MTIRDRIIRTGSIALAGDLFRFAEPGAWIRAPTRNRARGYAPGEPLSTVLPHPAGLNNYETGRQFRKKSIKNLDNLKKLW